MDINERIFEILNQQGMKQADLARAIGASSGLVADWKNNNKTPKMKYICQIADYLNVSVDYLLGRTDDPTPVSNSDTVLSSKEEKLIQQYRAKPEMQTAVDTLLGLDS